MSKQISTKIGLLVIFIFVAVLGIIFWAVLKASQPQIQTNIQPPAPHKTSNNQQIPSQKTKDENCLNSGGSIGAASCCQSSGDFPNNCAIGACGCAPASSHQVKTCNCGEGKCFDGNSCVDAKALTSQTDNSDTQLINVPTNWKKYSNVEHGFEIRYPINWTFSAEKVDPSSPTKYFYVTLTSPETKKLGKSQGDYPSGDLEVTAYQSLKDFNSGEKYQTNTLQESLNKLESDGIIENIKETSVNGNKAFEANRFGMGVSFYTLYLEKSDGKIYELDFSLVTARKYFSAVENTILSSFKFI